MSRQALNVCALKTAGHSSRTEKNEDIQCQICPSNKARFGCSECKQFLCENCLTYHQKFNGTYKHTVCPLPTSEPQEAQTECQVHNLHKEFYCADDKMECCAKCKESCHKNCSKIVHFSDYIATKGQVLAEICKLKRQVENKRKEVEHCHQLLKQKTESWNQCISEELKEMEFLMNNLKDKVKQKQQSHSELLKKRDLENEKLMTSYAIAIQDLGCKSAKLKSVFMTEQELVIAIKENERAISQYQSLLDSNPCEGHTVALLKEEHRFEAEHYVTRTLDQLVKKAKSIENRYTKKQPNSLLSQSSAVTHGRDSVTRRHSSGESTESKKIPRHRTLSEYEKVKHYESLIEPKDDMSVPEMEATIQEIDIAMADDYKRCAITGIAELSNGNIILSDFSNFKLKLMDENDQIIHSLKTNHEPRDIAVIDKNNVMVSMPMAKHIQFVEIYKDNTDNAYQLTLGKTCPVDGKCCGIAFHDNKIYTATQMPTQILVLDMKGLTLNKICGNELFERPTYTTIAPNGSLIYLSDPNRKFVIGLTTEGQIKFKYHVEGPHAITTNERGELFVADFESSSVHLVSQEGQKLAYLSPEGCNCPQKVSYNKQTKCLLLTMWNSNTIFKIKLLGHNYD